jgi:hypothetical protein
VHRRVAAQQREVSRGVVGPEPHRLSEGGTGSGQITGLPGLSQQPAEREHVQLRLAHLQGVAAEGRHQQPVRFPPGSGGREQPPQAADVPLHRVHRGGGRVLTPQSVDDRLHGHDLARREGQQAQDRALPLRAEIHRRPVHPCRQGTENPDPDTGNAGGQQLAQLGRGHGSGIGPAGARDLRASSEVALWGGDRTARHRIVFG